MTQTEWVLKRLRFGLPLTPIDALNGCGCFRLAAIVFDLKKTGWNIETIIVKKDKKRYASYVLQTPERL